MGNVGSRSDPYRPRMRWAQEARTRGAAGASAGVWYAPPVGAWKCQSGAGAGRDVCAGGGRLWGAVPLDNSHVGKVDSSLILNQLGFISL